MRPVCRANSLFLLLVLSSFEAACGDAGRVITSPKFDASAKQVELFQGLEDGTFETKVIPLGPQGGNLLIVNKTDQPLTVKMPKSFVAVHVLKQFQPLQPNGIQNNQTGNQQQGAQQAVGGGSQQNNGQANPFGNGANGNAQGNGNGFFSIPPERTIKVSYVSTCLEHGKADPTPRANYKLVRTADYTKDRVLQQLIAMVASGRLNAKSAQAAIWNRTDDMTWRELAHKYSYSVMGKVPYFRASELSAAKEIASHATKLADDNSQSTTPETSVAVRAR